jgi:hypothetical protein
VDKKIKETKKQVSRLKSRIDILESIVRGDADTAEAESGSKRKRRKKRSKSGKRQGNISGGGMEHIEHILKELDSVKRNHRGALDRLDALMGSSEDDSVSRSIRFATLRVKERGDDDDGDGDGCLASEDVSREVLLALKAWNEAWNDDETSSVRLLTEEWAFLENCHDGKTRPHVTLSYLRPSGEGRETEERRWAAFKDMDGHMFEVESESVIVATVMHAESVVCRIVYIRMMRNGALSEHEAPHTSVFGYFVEGLPGFKLPWTPVDPVAARDIEEHLQSGKDSSKVLSIEPDFLGPVWSGGACEVEAVEIAFRRKIRTKCSIQLLPC